MSGSVIELATATIESTSSVLRAIADEIDAGKYGSVSAGVIVVCGDDIHAFGSGDANVYKAVWMLEAAKQNLLP
jgi:hypothetical protein